MAKKWNNPQANLWFLSQVELFIRLALCLHTGFPPKNASFLKIKNIPGLLSYDKEGKLMLNIDF